MTEVVVLVLDRRARARIAEALRASGHPMFCELASAVRAAIDTARDRGARIGAVIVEPRDLEGTPTTALISYIRERAPAVPVLAYCAAGPEASADLLAVARAGVSGVLLRGHDDVGSALRSAITSATDDCAARQILRELDPVLPREVRSLVEHAVQHGRSPLTVAGVARALGVHRKTLVNRLAAAGLPEPRTVITWCRLCVVAVALEDPGVSIERVALEFDFASATAFRNLCKRYTGLRAGEVRQNGGLACILHLFRQALRRELQPATRSRVEREGRARD